MTQEKVLALDLSTKTGWSFVLMSEEGMRLMDYGTIPQIPKPNEPYPGSFVSWAYLVFNSILELINKFQPSMLVIEETSKGSKNAMSQKILEYSHFLLAKYIKESHIGTTYILTEEWRREIGCVMTKAEKLRNKEVRQYKKKHKTSVAYDSNKKRTGIIGRKHINVRRANEIFGDQLKEPLRQKNEDLADSLGLISCYYYRKYKKKVSENKVEEISLEDLVRE